MACKPKSYIIEQVKYFRNSVINRKENGFTLIEILAVIAILGILATVAVVQFASYKDHAYDNIARQQLRNLALAMESYYILNNDYGLVSAGGVPNAAALQALGYTMNIFVTFTRPSPAPAACADEGQSCWTAEAFHINGTAGVDGLFKWDSAAGGAQW